MTNPSSYGVVKLNDYVYFQEGPGIRNSQNTSEGVRFLNIRCFVDGRLDTASMKKVSENEAYGKYKHFLLDVGDYVVSSSGTLGRIAEVYPEDIPVMLNTSTIRFRPIKNEFLDRLYLRYFLESEVFQQQVKSLATGSVQLNYGPSHLAFVEMPLPPIKSQRAIGEVLDNLTKQISLNHALSKTLEDIAQTIFKSWFIDFDPVKAKMNGEKPKGMNDATAALFPDSFEESELGLIPKGWNAGSLEEIIEIYDSKRVPLSGAERKKSAGIFPYYGATGILDYIDEYIFDGPHVLVGEDGTVITELGTPLVQYVWGKFWVSNHAHVLGAKQGFSVEHLKLLIERIQISNYITGAVQPKLNQGNLKSIPCVIPSVEVSTSFGSIIEPFFSNIRCLADEIKTLSELRDSLLPRLISGELQIPEEMLAS